MMVITKARFCVFMVLLTTTISSKDSEETQEDFLSQQLDSAFGLLDEDTVELLWTTCSMDLIHLKEEVGDFYLCFPQETSSTCSNEISSEIHSLARENIQKLINACHPQLKQIFLHCLRKSNLPLHCISKDENDDFNVWHATCIKSLFFESNTPRRNLGLELPQHMSKALGLGPTIKSHIQAQKLKSLSLKKFGSSPSEKETSPEGQPQATKSTFSNDKGGANSSPTNAKGDGSSKSKGAASSKAKGGANKKSDNKNMVIIIVAAATASVILVVVLLCVCCCCCRKSQVRKNDERPLLSLSKSDHSVGSSPKYASGNSVRDEKFRFQSIGNNSINHKRAQSLNGNFPVGFDVQEILSPRTVSVGAIATRSSFDLKPPPGRVGTSLLKPPPGKSDLLSAKPPSFKPFSDDATIASSPSPPPPPPPAPVPPKHPKTTTGPPPPPPPTLPGAKKGASAPPPLPKICPTPPRPPPLMGTKVARPLAVPKKPKASATSVAVDYEDYANAPKAKLKPFFWDKVQANSDQSMVWNQLKAGSFQLDEEMMEMLFGYSNPNKNKDELKKRSTSLESAPQFIQIIDSKKSQNLSILLRALNVTMEEVSDALREGNELPSEFIQSLLKMAPTSEEELKLRLFNGNLSQLGPAERFLKALVNIPFSFKRLEALLFMGTLQEDLATTKESFAILEVASKELRSSRLFLKLLEAVLKTGNRMNSGTFRGGAQAFKLDTLLKLSDVKGVDGKTTLLHFVVKEIIRSEGIRAVRGTKESRSFSSIKTEDLFDEVSSESEERYCDLGLQVVSHLSSELENVKKAAALDADNLTGSAAKLGHGLLRTKEFLNKDLKDLEVESRGGFYQTVESFVESAENDVTSLLEEEKRIMDLVKSTGDYFHGNSGRDEGLRLFVIVRDFLIMLDKVCKEVGDAQKKAATAKAPKQEASKASSDIHPPPSLDHRKQIFSVISDRRMDESSSDDDSS